MKAPWQGLSSGSPRHWSGPPRRRPPRSTSTPPTPIVWEARGERLRPVAQVAGVPYDLLCGIERVSELLFENTRRFAAGLPANNALLWGARGMGKSSLVKAIHARLNEGASDRLILIEIHREDIESLPRLLHLLADSGRRCLLFCDDLSFDAGETSYKSLKAVLEGGIEGRPGQRPVLRHLEPPPPDAAADDRQ